MAKARQKDAQNTPAAGAEANPSGKSFEELLAETEALVDALESGELPLEASLAKYEEGIANLRQCSAILRQARQSVERLVEQGGNQFALEPFEDDGGEPDEPGSD